MCVRLTHKHLQTADVSHAFEGFIAKCCFKIVACIDAFEPDLASSKVPEDEEEKQLSGKERTKNCMLLYEPVNSVISRVAYS